MLSCLFSVVSFFVNERFQSYCYENLATINVLKSEYPVSFSLSFYFLFDALTCNLIGFATINIKELNNYLCVGAFGNNSPTLLQLMIIAQLKPFVRKLSLLVRTFCPSLFSVDLGRESARWSSRWTGQVYWGNYHKLNHFRKQEKLLKLFCLFLLFFRTCESYRIKEICWSLNWKKCHSCL